jgi:hypothetical protein
MDKTIFVSLLTIVLILLGWGVSIGFNQPQEDHYCSSYTIQLGDGNNSMAKMSCSEYKTESICPKGTMLWYDYCVGFAEDE